MHSPEQVLEREKGSRCSVTGANEDRVARCLEENNVTMGMSQEDVLGKQEALRKFETQQAKKESNKKRDYFQKSMPGESQQQVEARKQQFDSGGLHVGANPMEAHQPRVRDLDLSSPYAEALLGTLVCLRNDPGRIGIIRWIGRLPEYPRSVIAGIEMVSAFVT